MDRIDDLPIMVMPGLEGNVPTSLNAVQLALLPHLALIEFFWWTVWWGILGYLVIRHLVIPIFAPLVVAWRGQGQGLARGQPPQESRP